MLVLAKNVFITFNPNSRNLKKKKQAILVNRSQLKAKVNNVNFQN